MGVDIDEAGGDETAADVDRAMGRGGPEPGLDPDDAAVADGDVEIPLKAVVRGYTWTVVPITWRNRRTGEAKLKIKEMGSRYLFICLYVWLEKYFSRGDYKKK